MAFKTYTDAVHKFSILYPADWTVVRSDNPGASIVTQITCESDEDYKRISVAWDDVSWSDTTAESFGRDVVAQLGSLVPGSTLLHHGLYDPGSGSGGPYQILYKIVDPIDASELHLFNVVVVSAHDGRRRAYTITFGVDGSAWSPAMAELARHIVGSFRVGDADRVGGRPPSTTSRQQTVAAGFYAGGSGASGGGSSAGGVGLPAGGVGISMPSPPGGVGGSGSRRGGRSSAASVASTASSGGEEEEHVNVWDRMKQQVVAGAAAAAGRLGTATTAVLSLATAVPAPGQPVGGGIGAGPAGPFLAAPAAFPDTSFNPAEVSWATGSLPQAALAYTHPGTWTSSGIGHDESQGFAPLAMHSARRWCIAYTCDRRENAFKHMSVICVDVTPCYEAITARLSKNPKALGDSDAGTLLLTYVLYRYRCELAEAEARAAGRPPHIPPIAATGDEAILRSWADVFSQRWPVTCRVAAPSSSASPVEVVVPVQLSILDQRVVANSRLLKVGGRLRSTGGLLDGDGSGAAGGASSGGGGSEPARHGGSRSGRHNSIHSGMSFDGDRAPAEGLLIQTTSAVLVGLHDAVVPIPGAQRSAGGGRTAAPPPTHKRVFSHIVTFATSAPAFARYEALAKHVFQSLDARST